MDDGPATRGDIFDAIESLKDFLSERRTPSFVGKMIRVYQDHVTSLGPGIGGDMECLDAVATPFCYMICVRSASGSAVWFDSRRAAGIEVVEEAVIPSSA